MDAAVRTIKLIEVWEERMDPHIGWVLFEHGTCVLCNDGALDVEVHAKTVLAEWGPVVPGTPLGDFNFEIEVNPPGILVTYAHPDIFTFLLEEDMEDANSPLGGALAARYWRGEDAQSLRIVHIHPASKQGSFTMMK